MKDLTVVDVTRMYLQAGIITQYKHGYVFHSAESDLNLYLVKDQLKRNLVK